MLHEVRNNTEGEGGEKRSEEEEYVEHLVKREIIPPEQKNIERRAEMSRGDAQPERCRLAAPLPGAISFPKMKLQKQFLSIRRKSAMRGKVPTSFSIQIRAGKQ